jgi:hypothetical protein
MSIIIVAVGNPAFNTILYLSGLVTIDPDYMKQQILMGYAMDQI